MTLEEKFEKYGIPGYMRGALTRYLEDKILPGSFLTAVLENDLKGAVAKADANNVKLLPNYVAFLWNVAPNRSWGSPEKVSAWLGGGSHE